MQIEQRFRWKYKPRLVAIVGGSGSGKTWLARQLQSILGKEAGHFSLDDFYRDRSHLTGSIRRRINFDHPRAIDWTAFKNALHLCRRNKPFVVPQYDFATHCQKCEALFAPRPLMLIDGLWLLRSPGVRRFFDCAIFLDCPASVRLQRRLQRDCAERGRDEKMVKSQFSRVVAPMHERFVAPQKRWANIVFPHAPDSRQVDQLAETLQKLVPKI